MRNIIVGTVSAAVLAMSLVTPAAAENRDREVLVPLIIGALGLYIIHDRKDRNKPVVAHRPHRPVATPPRTNRKVLPQNCFKRVRTDRGRRGIFGQRCLNRTFAHVDRLPRACRVRVEGVRGRTHRGFGARCLKKRGYRMSSH